MQWTHELRPAAPVWGFLYSMPKDSTRTRSARVLYLTCMPGDCRNVGLPPRCPMGPPSPAPRPGGPGQ
eukprot:1333329-Prorocentrum_lima.AAC.1